MRLIGRETLQQLCISTQPSQPRSSIYIEKSDSPTTPSLHVICCTTHVQYLDIHPRYVAVLSQPSKVGTVLVRNQPEPVRQFV